MTAMRTHLLSLGIVLLAVGLVKAQTFDSLEQARQDLRLKAQKLKAELQANFYDANLLDRTNPEKAFELLRKNRILLEDDAYTLSERERKAYLDEVNVKINRLIDRAAAAKKADEVNALKAANMAEFKRRLDADAAKAAALAYGPSNVIAAAQQPVYSAIASQRQLLENMRRAAAQPPGFTQPPKSDLTVPTRDIAIMNALISTMKVSIKQQQMKDVLEMLEDKTKGALSFIVDEQTLRAIDVGLPETFLNDSVTKVIGQPQKVRTLLKLILGDRNMGYYIQDGSIWITTAAVAKTKMVVKNYPVANLLGGQQLVQMAIMEVQSGGGGQGPGGPGGPGGGGGSRLGPNGQLLSQNLDGLMNKIKGNLEQDYWSDNGGPGTMQFVPASASLQVRASLEVQYLLMASGLVNNVPPR